MLTYLYEQAIPNTDYGYATALAILNLAVVLIVASVVYFITRRDPTEAR
ncbi:MAG: hypothetical protein K8R88_11495 [Armatimonadetes bacterium]|nr:hypothetical protein [Armatimonadota bacterium]